MTPRPSWARQRLFAALLAGGGAAVALILLFLRNPVDWPLFPRCLLFQWTGLYCPGCGSARAVHAMLHADLATAFARNPLAVLFLPPVALVLAAQILAPRSRLAVLPERLPAAAIWAIFVLFLGFAILRNLPWAPFTVLAP